MHKIFLDLLECPGYHGSLSWKWLQVHRERIEEAEAHYMVIWLGPLLFLMVHSILLLYRLF